VLPNCSLIIELMQEFPLTLFKTKMGDYFQVPDGAQIKK
jgi:hypothetical protein